MGFNRPEAKRLTKLAIHTTSPHPMLVTLVFVLLTGVLGTVVSVWVSNPFELAYLYLLDGVYDPMYIYRMLLTPGTVVLYLVVSVLLGLYNSVMQFGYASYTLRMARGEQPGYRNLFDGFAALGRALLVSILTSLFLFLWGMLAMVPYMVIGILAGVLGSISLMLLALLLLIGGIVVMIMISYRYRLATYFLLDHPDMGALAAITQSKEAMRGWKGELFILDWSFFGWYALAFGAAFVIAIPLALISPTLVSLAAVVVSGIFDLWLAPYISGTEANFYDWRTHGALSYREDSGPGGYQSPYGSNTPSV